MCSYRIVETYLSRTVSYLWKEPIGLILWTSFHSPPPQFFFKNRTYFSDIDTPTFSRFTVPFLCFNCNNVRIFGFCSVSALSILWSSWNSSVIVYCIYLVSFLQKRSRKLFLIHRLTNSRHPPPNQIWPPRILMFVASCRILRNVFMSWIWVVYRHTTLVFVTRPAHDSDMSKILI